MELVEPCNRLWRRRNGKRQEKFNLNRNILEGKMERVNSKRAGRKKFPSGIASLGIAVAIVLFVSTAAVGPAHAQATRIQQSEVSLVPVSA